MTYGSTTAEKKRHLLRTSTTPMGIKQEFSYDDFGNTVMSKTVNGTTSVIGSKTEYDAKHNYPVKSYDTRGNAATRSINPSDYTLTSVTAPDGQTVSYSYDDAKRVTGVQTQANGKSYKNTYTYQNGRIEKVAHNTTGDECEYAYDARGNIISEKRNGLTTTYAYDALGQLIRVNDPHENATWVYTYDCGGNILSKARYAYTTGELGAAVEYVPYTYGDANWKDKLTAYNGVPITYDAIGNPLVDRNSD